MGQVGYTQPNQGVNMDKYWNDQADKLNKALLDNPQALVLHYVRTAPPEALSALVGDTLPESGKTLSSVRAVLAARLDQATSVDALASSQ
jgi:hypothetical protein